MEDYMSARVHSLRCPYCEASELEFPGPNSARCPYCGGFLGGALLKTLRQIAQLPNASGSLLTLNTPDLGKATLYTSVPSA
jgi:hypothetical protein